MMHFEQPVRDGCLLAELKEWGLLTPDRMERIDLKLGRPEIGTLNQFLLAGAGIIPEGDWLSWLIRHHGCHRFGRVAWTEETAALAPRGPGPEGNLPYRRGPLGTPMVAILRPDRWEETAGRYGAAGAQRAAATLAELRELELAWKVRVAEAGTP
jgi:hypothetical protein